MITADSWEEVKNNILVRNNIVKHLPEFCVEFDSLVITPTRIVFDVSQDTTLTFDHLAELSRIFNTRKIDILTGGTTIDPTFGDVTTSETRIAISDWKVSE